MSENWRDGFRVCWYLLGPLLFYGLVYDGVTVLWSGIREGAPFVISQIPEYVAASAVGTVLLGIWFFREGLFFDQEKLRHTVLKQRRTRWLMLIAAASSACIFVNHMLALSGISFAGYDTVQNHIFQMDKIWQIAGSGFFVPLAEEFVFRGLGYQRLRRRMDMFPAAVITAALFGLYHGNLIQGIYGFLMGILLAAVYEAYGCFLAPCLFHAAANLTAIVLNDSWFYERISEHRAAISVLVILCGGILWNFVLKIREDIN